MERYLFIPINIEDWHWTSCYVQVGPRIRDPKSVGDNLAPRMQYGDSYGHRDEQESRKPKGLELKVSLGLTNALNCVVSPTVNLLHVPMQTEVECASRVIENAASIIGAGAAPDQQPRPLHDPDARAACRIGACGRRRRASNVQD